MTVLKSDLVGLTADDLRVDSIEHLHINGVRFTVFKVCRVSHNMHGEKIWVYEGEGYLRGTIKRAATIIKKLIEQKEESRQ